MQCRGLNIYIYTLYIYTYIYIIYTHTYIYICIYVFLNFSEFRMGTVTAASKPEQKALDPRGAAKLHCCFWNSRVQQLKVESVGVYGFQPLWDEI